MKKKKIYSSPEHFTGSFSQKLEYLLKSQDIDLSKDQLSKMLTHAETLMIWNKKTNLTAITDPLQMAEKHFYDSIMAASFINGKITSIADIGSGGGFPGIPLKIIKPQIKVLMIDASQKKINFLKHVIRLLGLNGIEAVHLKLEPGGSDQGDLSGLCGQDGHGGHSGRSRNNPVFPDKFDAVISRALTDIESFSDMALLLLKPEGRIYAMKGRGVKKELTESLTEKFDSKMYRYVLPCGKADRYLVELAQDIKVS